MWDSATGGSEKTLNTPSRAHAAAAGTFLIGGDLSVHRLGFGAMRITGPGIWGPPTNPHEARAVLRRALDLGINFIDTADAYGPEVSENLIAETLHPYPAHLVIATKGGLTRTGPNQWVPVGRPDHLRRCVDQSLRRLRLERIDLYQLHRIDPQVSVEESLGALKEMQQQGKIRHLGLSQVGVGDIERARKVATIVSVQNLYNLTNRQSEPVVEYCEAHGLCFIPFFPIASGKLARSGGRLGAIAQRKAATAVQVSLAWLLRRSPVMVPIPGTSSVAHLEENVAAASLGLTDAEFAALGKTGRWVDYLRKGRNWLRSVLRSISRRR
jgi:aryl-alcohol dehydrogenase-like predicted oxidoreductase